MRDQFTPTRTALRLAGFVHLVNSDFSGMRCEIYASRAGCALCLPTFRDTNHWRAAGLAVLVQEWRWLRLILGPSRRIRKG